MDKVEKVLNPFALSNEVLQRVSDILLQEFNKGLSKETHDVASVKMFPTHVREIPDDSEQCKCLVLDLGTEKDLRISSIQLFGSQKYSMETFHYELADAILVGSGKKLFDFIAECLSDFVKDEEDLENLPLVFTFAFPCLQSGLTSGTLVQWSKGFNCAGVVGKDVVHLLAEAINTRKDLSVDAITLVNDATGALMSCAYQNKNVGIGLVVGRGTNACYLEDLDLVETWVGDREDPLLTPQQVIVNTEWAAFGDDGCLEFVRTPFDQEVDADSLDKNSHLFEKMISGLYMGEVARRVIVKLVEENVIFCGSIPELFNTPYAFNILYLCDVERDEFNNTTSTKTVLGEMGVDEPTENDCDVVKIVCKSVSTRAAHLVAAGVATILNKMRREHTTIGVDGSVYRYHPHFKTLMEQKIRELAHPSCGFGLMMTEDGVERGAALVRAVEVRRSKSKVFTFSEK